MVSVTERAATVLARTLQNGDAGPDLGFRVVPAGPDAIALTIDGERDGDQVVRHLDQTVLLLESWVAYVLDGAVFDVDEHPEGASLTLSGLPRMEVGG